MENSNFTFIFSVMLIISFFYGFVKGQRQARQHKISFWVVHLGLV